MFWNMTPRPGFSGCVGRNENYKVILCIKIRFYIGDISNEVLLQPFAENYR